MGKGSAERLVALPVIRSDVRDNALQCCRDIVPRMPRSLPAARRRPGDAFPIRIEQYLARVKTQPSLRVERSGDAIGVELSRDDAGHKDVPIMVGAVRPRIEVDDPRGLWGVDAIEQQQLSRRVVFGENAEIGAPGNEGRAQRVTLAGLATRSVEAVHPAAARRFLRSAERPPESPSGAARL